MFRSANPSRKSLVSRQAIFVYFNDKMGAVVILLKHKRRVKLCQT